MARQKSTLDRVRIAAPCGVGWANMKGDDRVRYCEHCQMNVYNLSAMTRREAEGLLREMTGPMCVSIFRRKDGTVLTADCPVGRRLARRAALHALSAAACVFGVIIGLASSRGLLRTNVQLADIAPFNRLTRWLATPPPAPAPPANMGDRSDGGLIP